MVEQQGLSRYSSKGSGPCLACRCVDDWTGLSSGKMYSRNSSGSVMTREEAV